MNGERFVAIFVTILVATSVVATGGGTVTADGDLDGTVESVNENEIADSNAAIDDFNAELQDSAGLLGVDVDDVDHVDEVTADNPADAEAEADRLRADADDRQAAIFNRVVTVIDEGDVDDMNHEDVQTPEDAREEADRLEGGGVLKDKAADSLRDAADLVEEDLQPPLNDASDALAGLGDGGGDDGDDGNDGDDGDGGDIEVVSFNATGGTGYAAFAADDATDPADDGVPIEAVEFEGEIDPNAGTWKATSASIPEITIEDAGIFGADAVVDIEPDDLGGDVDLETGEMTLGGELDVEAEVSYRWHQVPCEFGFEFDATTGDSNELSGERLDLDSDAPSATLVDNEYTVDEDAESDEFELFTCDSTNEELGLDTDPGAGENFLELELEFDVDRTVTGTVTDDDGTPIEGATIELDGSGQTTETDADGTYWLALESDGNYALSVTAPEHDGVTDELTVSGAEPTTADYELEPDHPEPTAVIDVDDAVAGQEITLSGAGSASEEFDVTSYEWTIDGDPFDGETVTTSFDDPGEYTVELTVANSAGETDTVATTVSVAEADDTQSQEPETDADADGDPESDGETDDENPESDGETDDDSSGALSAGLATAGLATGLLSIGVGSLIGAGTIVTTGPIGRRFDL